MRAVLLALALVVSTTVSAGSSLPFMKDLAGDATLPLPWGIGIDFYTMEQKYDIDSLTFSLGDVSLDDPSLLAVDNSVQHFDLKFDAWLLPFLNVFGLLGYIDADTIVDVSGAPIQNLPFPLKTLDVSYDGTVYGVGFTLAYGNENWFTTVTTTYTDTDLSGNFDSSVESITVQPRIGLVRDQWQFWVGGLFLDTEESHSGSVGLPLLDETGNPVIVSVPFNVMLSGADEWNAAVGARHVFSPKADISFEIGFGDRSHTLLNFTYRF